MMGGMRVLCSRTKGSSSGSDPRYEAKASRSGAKLVAFPLLCKAAMHS